MSGCMLCILYVYYICLCVKWISAAAQQKPNELEKFFFLLHISVFPLPCLKKYSELLHIWVEPAVRLLAWLSEDVLLIFIAPIHNQSDRHSINFFINKQQTHELTLKIFWSSSTLCTGQPVRFIWWLSL